MRISFTFDQNWCITMVISLCEAKLNHTSLNNALSYKNIAFNFEFNHPPQYSEGILVKAN